MADINKAAGKALMKVRLKEIQDAAEFAERNIKRELRRPKRYIEEVSEDQSLSEEDRWEMQDVYSDRAIRFRSTYRHHLRNSLFLTAYSQFEVDLDWLAHVLMEQTDTSRSPSDLPDKGITRSQTYIKKELNLPFPDTNREWQLICGLNELRNDVAHGRNELDDPEDPEGKDKNAWQLVREWESIEVIPDTEFGKTHYYFVLGEHFLADVVKTIGRFWEDLFNGIS